MTLIEDFESIGSGAGGIAALGAVALELWAKLNTARTCAILVNNATDHPLRVVNHHHDWGGFAAVPDLDVPPHTASLFGSQSSGGSLFTGTEGRVIYTIRDINTLWRVEWSNPFAGSNNCTTGLEGEHAAAFESQDICGVGNDAEMRYELRQARDLRFVRGPDYRWSRLEGYVLPTLIGDPDRPPPYPGPVRALHNYWSPSRGDNFATSDPAFDRMETLHPDYRRSRFEGNVFSPGHTPPPGTVPLHSWWSPSRRDNFATTNPAYTRPLRDRLEPDYSHYRLEGYVYSPEEPQPDGTLALHSWYSPSRGDNFLTSDPKYLP